MAERLLIEKPETISDRDRILLFSPDSPRSVQEQLALERQETGEQLMQRIKDGTSSNGFEYDVPVRVRSPSGRVLCVTREKHLVFKRQDEKGAVVGDLFIFTREGYVEWSIDRRFVMDMALDISRISLDNHMGARLVNRHITPSHRRDSLQQFQVLSYRMERDSPRYYMIQSKHTNREGTRKVMHVLDDLELHFASIDSTNLSQMEYILYLPPNHLFTFACDDRKEPVPQGQEDV